MCLQEVHATSRQTDEEQVFYKVALEKDARYVTPFVGCGLEIGQTYVADLFGASAVGRVSRQSDHSEPQGLHSQVGEEYKAGFHLLTSAEDAERFAQSYQRLRSLKGLEAAPLVILEVSAVGIHTVGVDRGLLTVVAREITPLRVLEPAPSQPDEYRASERAPST